MASPPAKRQRRSTIILSDDDESASPARLPLRGSTKSNTRAGSSQLDKTAIAAPKSRPNPAKRKTFIKPSPKSSPEKPKQKRREKKVPENTRSLHTFFGKATEEQRWNRKASTPDGVIDDGEFGDDIVDDDSLDEVLLELADSKRPGQDELDQKKVNSTDTGQRQVPTLGQRFVKQTIPSKRPKASNSRDSFSIQEEDNRPWSERYAPTNIDELAVNKKKVADVQSWLTDVLSGRDRRRILVLKGPAGSGKSTTIYLLAKVLGIQLISWNNPTASEAGVTSSIALQFDDFLSRSGRFGSLMVDVPPPMDNVSGTDSSYRLLVVEEFPTTITRSSVALDSFRSALLKHLATSESLHSTMLGRKQNNAESSSPLVIIITETLLSSSTAATDSFTAHRLLGPELFNHPLVNLMDFNPVAPTFLLKALDNIIKKEARDSRRRRIPGPAVLQRLAEIGDIRSAINSLEFLCVRGDDTGDWSGTVATKLKRTNRDNVPLTSMEKSSLELVSQRESTLDMFHATGKVVYNKREDRRMSDTRAEPPPKPPDHLIHLDKAKVSQVDIEALLSETGTDIQTFLSALHENYILSCNGTDFVDAFEGCANFLSDSDVLNPETRSLTQFSRSGSRPSPQFGGTDVLRQDEISFQVATRGLLFCLPFPVNRAAHPGGRKGDSFKMFYPASLRLWKPTEEIGSLISLFMTQSQQTPSTAAGSRPTTEGVALWGERVGGLFLEARKRADDSDDVNTQAPNTRLYSSRDELSLEILPYLARIRSSRKEDSKILNKVTQLCGLHMMESTTGEEPFDDEVMADILDPSLARPPTSSQTRIAAALSRYDQSQAQRRNFAAGAAGQQKSTLMQAQEVAMEKLYISDDDIQDD